MKHLTSEQKSSFKAFEEQKQKQRFTENDFNTLVSPGSLPPCVFITQEHNESFLSDPESIFEKISC